MTRYDVAIIGSGPSGMSAAVRLSAMGVSVVVLDEQPEPGGQIWRGTERNSGSPMSAALGADYEKGKALVATFRGADIDYQPNTQVWQIEEGWSLYTTRKGETHRTQARIILLANGAQERPAPFHGWTLPGVMTVGAAQILLKSGGMLPQGNVWIAGAGPLPLLYATQLLDLGGCVAGYLDTSKPMRLAALRHLPQAWRDLPNLIKGYRWQQNLKRTGSYVGGVSDLFAAGDDRLENVGWTSAGRPHRANADVLLVHEGVVPRIHETLALGCDHAWNEPQSYLYPKLDRWGETSRRDLFVSGDASGIGGWLPATISGEIAALGIADRLGVLENAEGVRRQEKLDSRRRRALALRPFLDRFFAPPRREPADDVIICRCEEVTAGSIRKVARSSPPDPAAIKAATRCGMGPCQGRQCGYAVQALLAEVHGVPPRDIKFFNIRPPLKPVTLGEIAALETSEA